jgi:hypothetical protein
VVVEAEPVRMKKMVARGPEQQEVKKKKNDESEEYAREKQTVFSLYNYNKQDNMSFSVSLKRGRQY